MNACLANALTSTTVIAARPRGFTVRSVAVVGASFRGMTRRSFTAEANSGTPNVIWRDDGASLTAPTAHIFNGSLTAAYLAAL
ncbi:hypothetical protein [Cypionkella sp.]|uniref:hypothetical protein n=1 Tax=Cypionkella sp. TaxID=2811411 RepID=UPI002624CA57|nr:hypothetical protein [Cypionkella sp.]